ncbi:hypothetical protein C8R42DRAFT_721333 [Lentinula raphanica]|nr:hypothetical protein C8R42DRAFT_721333 [Lentinula raphanica]
MQVSRTSLIRSYVAPHVRFNSSDATKASLKRLAASWDDIHIPSPREVKEGQRTGSLSSRLAARRPQSSSPSATFAPPTPTENASIPPKLIPVAPRQENLTPRKNSPSKRVPQHVSFVKKADANLQSAADLLDDLSQVIPNDTPSVSNSWEKSLESLSKQESRPPSKATQARNVAGRSWTPEGGHKVTGRAARAPVTRGSSAGTGTSAKKANDRTSSRDMMILNEIEDTSVAEAVDEDDENAQIYLDDTVIDGVSLLAPRPGQSAQLWYESIIQQNREPDGPSVIYPDIDISSDMHSLFGVNRAQQRSVMVSHLGSLKLTQPTHVKKGKVEYQVRKVMRRYGGDYSYLQPNLVPTDLRKKMRPSQLARLNMSRRNEASAEQRKTFDSIISTTLSKDVDTVEQPHP